jgi:hypothetical protein
MLEEQLIRETLKLQGFRIESVEKKDSELLFLSCTGMMSRFIGQYL